MTTNDDIDRLVADQLRTDAPGRAPAWLLEDTMNRIANTPQRRRAGFLGSTAGRLLAAAAVLLIAVVAGTQLAGLIDRPPDVGASPAPSASPSDPPSPSGAAASPSPQPTASPAGSADELVLRVVAGGGGPTPGYPPLPWASVMADGTVVWQPTPTGPETPSLMTRRLTPDGLDELRERIFDGGLLDADASHELERLPNGPEPLGRGVMVFFFTAGTGDDRVDVSAVQWLGDDEESTYYQPSPEREALDALARALTDPEALLGEDAWAGAAGPYEAAEYLVLLRPMRDTPPYGVPDVADVPLPLDGPLDEYGEEAGSGDPLTRCGLVSRAEAAAIIEAILVQGSGGMASVTSASLDWAEGNGVVDVHVVPRMPDGYPGCGDT